MQLEPEQFVQEQQLQESSVLVAGLRQCSAQVKALPHM